MENNLPKKYYDPEHKGYCTPTWIYLHAVADSFPINPSSNDIENVEQLYNNNIPNTFPCSICRGHLLNEVKEYPISAKNGGESLSKQLYALHNRVNLRLGKRALSYEECRNEQEWLRAINFTNLLNDLKEMCKQNDDNCSIVNIPHTIRHAGSAEHKYTISIFLGVVILLFLILFRKKD